MPLSYNTHWSGEIAAKDMPPTSIGRVTSGPKEWIGRYLRLDGDGGFTFWRELNHDQRYLHFGPGSDVRVVCIDSVTFDRDGNVVKETTP